LKKEKKTIIVFSYYSPEELTGIGKYNGELLSWLLSKGKYVFHLASAPFYPYWSLYEGYQNKIYQTIDRKENFKDVRTGVYIPKSPGALKKIVSEFSFFISSFFGFIVNIKQVRSAKLWIIINPPFFLGLFPILFGKVYGAKVLLHIQDLQVDAARELRLLPGGICRILEMVEKRILKSADYVSTISEGMKLKIEKKKINKPILMLPNWSDLDFIKPIANDFWLHDHLKLDRSKKLIVYSGNIGEKQGLEIIFDTAEYFLNNGGLHFVLLGAGLYKQTLLEKVNKLQLSNVTFGDLVKKEDLNKMLNSSYIQLVVQKSAGADSFLPSKLTNILSAGCCAIVTAAFGTSLYEICKNSGCALVIPPDSANGLILEIDRLQNEDAEWLKVKQQARTWAESNLSINKCLHPLEELLK